MKVDYISGKFTDFRGDERDFTIAAVSEKIIGTYEAYIPENETCVEENVNKHLLLGISVRTVEDEHDEELGKQIALGKALKNPYDIIVVTNPGIINSDFVKAVLAKERDYFMENPGKYIAGYDARKEKYETQIIMTQAYDKLTEDEVIVYEYLMGAPEDKIESLVELVEYDKKRS